MRKLITTSEFIKKASKTHKNKYDYSKSEYKGVHVKLKIICPNHGLFFQSPGNHLSGKGGCKKCSKVYHYTNNEFIEKVKKIHGDKYDYSKSIYIQNKQKIEIICNKHGPFYQRPDCHLKGQGCPKCNFEILLTNWESKQQINFLNYLKIKEKNICINNFNVDGYDSKTNTIYEFLGDYWHGNPKKYNPEKINKSNDKSFKELYDLTFQRFNKLKKLGYKIKYIWEMDWKRWNKIKFGEFPLIEY